jgi:hypothetical protein
VKINRREVQWTGSDSQAPGACKLPGSIKGVDFFEPAQRLLVPRGRLCCSPRSGSGRYSVGQTSRVGERTHRRTLRACSSRHGGER